jgi:hypothetical protein
MIECHTDQYGICFINIHNYAYKIKSYRSISLQCIIIVVHHQSAYRIHVFVMLPVMNATGAGTDMLSIPLMKTFVVFFSCQFMFRVNKILYYMDHFMENEIA